MYRLTRQVRFAINAEGDEQLSRPPANSFGGYPALTGIGQYFELAVTVEGPVDPRSNYLLNIKQIDDRVRREAVPLLAGQIRLDRVAGPADLLLPLFGQLREGWEPLRLTRLCLSLTPYLSLSVSASEHPMIRLSQKFEFSASHRLHNPALSEEENRRTFGKCNNPFGHGHNYEVQVTLIGRPDDKGNLIGIPAFEQIVNDTIIERYDHKYLNMELPEFRELIPSVENIAATIYRLLKPQFADRARLASVTVWETPKTWCEYSE